MLRDKANFSVLEGLLTVLFNDQTKIVEILESEGNQQRDDDKFNRVDIKAKNSKGEIIIVEVQNTRELYYLERILYGTAKAITEHISLGDTYRQVKKVYSISILGQRLPIPRAEPIRRRAHPRRAANHRKGRGSNSAKAARRDIPGILPDKGQRVQPGGKDPAGGVDTVPEDGRHKSRHHSPGPPRGA